MTRIKWKKTQCIECGHVSYQMVVCSVNFLVGTDEENTRQMKHQQQCPECGYTADDIGLPTRSEIDEILEILDADMQESQIPL